MTVCKVDTQTMNEISTILKKNIEIFKLEYSIKLKLNFKTEFNIHSIQFQIKKYKFNSCIIFIYLCTTNSKILHRNVGTKIAPYAGACVISSAGIVFHVTGQICCSIVCIAYRLQ